MQGVWQAELLGTSCCLQASGPNKYKVAAEFLVNRVVHPTAEVAQSKTQALQVARSQLEAKQKEVMEVSERLLVRVLCGVSHTDVGVGGGCCTYLMRPSRRSSWR